MGMGGGTNTVTNSAPPAYVQQAYQGALANAQQVASTPYTPYAGGNPNAYVAGLTPQQTQAMGEIGSAQGMAQPYFNQAQSDIQASTTPLWASTQQFSPSNVNQYYNPYVQNVVQATQAEFNNQNAMTANQITGNAASQGALGGNRVGVQQGITAGQEQLAQAPQIAGLEQSGYNSALGEFNTQQQAQLGANEANSWLNSQAGFGMSALGQSAEGTALTGANALMSSGTMQQQQNQAMLNVPYENYLAQQSYPFQTSQFVTNAAEGIGSQSGGTSSTTPSPYSTAMSGALGLGAMGLGAYSALAGTGVAAADLTTAGATAGSMAGMAGDLGLASMGFMKRGGSVQGFADGGAPDDYPIWAGGGNVGASASAPTPAASIGNPGSIPPPPSPDAITYTPPIPPDRAPSRGAGARGIAWDQLSQASGMGNPISAVASSDSGGMGNPRGALSGIPVAPNSLNRDYSDQLSKLERDAAAYKPNVLADIAEGLGRGAAATTSARPFAGLGEAVAGANQAYRGDIQHANDLMARVDEAKQRLAEQADYHTLLAGQGQQRADTGAAREQDYASRIALRNQTDLTQAQVRQLDAQTRAQLAAARIQNMQGSTSDPGVDRIAYGKAYGDVYGKMAAAHPDWSHEQIAAAVQGVLGPVPGAAAPKTDASLSLQTTVPTTQAAQAPSLPQIATPAKAAELPPGTKFRDPNGIIRTVPVPQIPFVP